MQALNEEFELLVKKMVRYGHVGGNSNHYHPDFGSITIRNRKGGNAKGSRLR